MGNTQIWRNLHCTAPEQKWRIFPLGPGMGGVGEWTRGLCYSEGSWGEGWGNWGTFKYFLWLFFLAPKPYSRFELEVHPLCFHPHSWVMLTLTPHCFRKPRDRFPRLRCSGVMHPVEETGTTHCFHGPLMGLLVLLLPYFFLPGKLLILLLGFLLSF